MPSALKIGLDIEQVKNLIISPVLKKINLYSESAVNLIIGTAAQESQFKYIKQLGGGPALGLFQMEPNTHDDIWDNYLAYRKDLASKVRALATQKLFFDHAADEMIGNVYYAAAMCRIHYLRAPMALPDADDIEGMANYWKTFYNTVHGAGTVDEFIRHYPHVH